MRGFGEDFDGGWGRREDRWEEGSGPVGWEGLDERGDEAEGEVYLAFDGVDYGEVAGYGIGAHEDEELAKVSVCPMSSFE